MADIMLFDMFISRSRDRQRDHHKPPLRYLGVEIYVTAAGYIRQIFKNVRAFYMLGYVEKYSAN